MQDLSFHSGPFDDVSGIKVSLPPSEPSQGSVVAPDCAIHWQSFRQWSSRHPQTKGTWSPDNRRGPRQRKGPGSRGMVHRLPWMHQPIAGNAPPHTKLDPIVSLGRTQTSLNGLASAEDTKLPPGNRRNPLQRMTESIRTHDCHFASQTNLPRLGLWMADYRRLLDYPELPRGGRFGIASWYR